METKTGSGGQMPTLGACKVPLVPSCPSGRVSRQLDLRSNQTSSLLLFLQRPWQQTKQDFWVHFTASCDSEVMSCSRLVSGPYSPETDRAEVLLSLWGINLLQQRPGIHLQFRNRLSEVQRQLSERSCPMGRCSPSQAPVLQS